MEADAGLLGSTKPELKRIKALGCPAFSDSGRVDIDLARQWLADRPKPAVDSQPLDSEGLLCLKLQRQIAAHGIRCVATDAPTLGGVDPKRALMTYWAMGSKGMVGVEFLTQVDKLRLGGYFLFAPVKIRDFHGGLGRAIALY